MREMASVVIRGSDGQRVFRWDETELVEELADVLHFGGERGVGRRSSPLGALTRPRSPALSYGESEITVPVMAIILQHRSTAGHVDDDRVHVLAIIGREVRVSHDAGQWLVARMEMDRAAADLPARHDHVAA